MTRSLDFESALFQLSLGVHAEGWGCPMLRQGPLMGGPWQGARVRANLVSA